MSRLFEAIPCQSMDQFHGWLFWCVLTDLHPIRVLRIGCFNLHVAKLSVASVAERRILRVLAHTEMRLLWFVYRERKWRERRPSMRTIAEWLSL